MIDNKRILAIIPARGGSKRLPRKNILSLAGKPLIAWTIEAGLKSKYIDEVVVTSDDMEILNVSKAYGALTVNRPAKLASDTSTTFDAVEHALRKQKTFDYVVLLQPTSPLRIAQHINEAIELLFDKKAEAVVSICEVEHSPSWSNVLPENGCMDSFLPSGLENIRSQDLEKYYRINGAIYISNTESLIKQRTFFLKKNIFGYIMESKSSIDIDTKFDFQLAEFLKNI